MDIREIETTADNYGTVATACQLETARRATRWAAAADSHHLSTLHDTLDATQDRLLDFGCCGYPWITYHLNATGYDIVGVDVPKSEWYTHDLVRTLDIPLIAYDGYSLPFDDDTFDAVLLFGVLEHVGIWKTPDEKYQTATPAVWEHRRAVLEEVARVVANTGMVLLTKYPNHYGRDRLYGTGHLPSERIRPDRLQQELDSYFEIQSFYRSGLLPHRLPVTAPTPALARWYNQLDDVLSNLPGLKHASQCFSAVLRPK